MKEVQVKSDSVMEPGHGACAGIGGDESPS